MTGTLPDHAHASSQHELRDDFSSGFCDRDDGANDRSAADIPYSSNFENKRVTSLDGLLAWLVFVAAFAWSP